MIKILTALDFRTTLVKPGPERGPGHKIDTIQTRTSLITSRLGLKWIKSGPGLKIDRNGTRSTMVKYKPILEAGLTLTRLKNLAKYLVKVVNIKTDMLKILPILIIKYKALIIHFYS